MVKCTNFLMVTITSCLVISCATSDSSTLPPPTFAEAPKPSSAVIEEGRTFKAGDLAEVIVEEDSSFNGSYVVRPEGYILIPKLGRISIAGLTRESAEARLKTELQRDQLAVATVYLERVSREAQNALQTGGTAPVEVRRLNIFLTGKVNRSGQHTIPIPAGQSSIGIYEALLIAGGPNNFGNLSKVEVMRVDANGRRVKSIVNVKDIAEGKAPTIPLGEGDIINVPEKVLGF